MELRFLYPIMATLLEFRSKYSAPKSEILEMETESVLCSSALNPGESENGIPGDDDL